MHGALIHLTGATDLAFTSVPGTDPPVFRQGYRQTRRPARPSGRGPDHRQGQPTVAALAHVLRRDRSLHSGRLVFSRGSDCAAIPPIGIGTILSASAGLGL